MTKKKYYLQWKGVQSGPFSIEEVERMLKFGEVGILHKIRMEDDDEFILLKDFDFTNASKIGVSGLLLEYLMYGVSGLSFLSVWLLIVGIICSAILWKVGYKSLSRRSMIATLIIGTLGLVFFKAIYPVLIQ